MSHHSRLRTLANTWQNVIHTELAAFDAALAASVNGVDGGCWAPQGLITWAGSGLALTGPLTVARGGTLLCNKGRLLFDAGVFPQLSVSHTGRTRNFVHAFAEARPVPYAMWRVHRGTSSVQSIAPTYTTWRTRPSAAANFIAASSAASAVPAGLSLPIRGVNGATISAFTISLTVPTQHTALPATMPGFRLLRVDASGNAVSCISSAAGADSNGWVYVPKPASVDAWFNGGAAQSYTFTVDQNNVVNRSTYIYRLEVIDEQGLTGWPWLVDILQPCRLLVNNLGSGGFQSVLTGLITTDTITVNSSPPPSDSTAAYPNRILVNGSPGYGETGIYIASAGSWTRAPDQFTRGCIVGVQEGKAYGGTMWQASSSVSSWTAGTTPPAAFWQSGQAYAINIPIVPATPSGFWYIATTGGTSGSNEPHWPTQIGSTIVDGSVTWTCSGPASTPLPFVTRPDADTWIPGKAFVANGTIFHTATMKYTGISQNAWQ